MRFILLLASIGYILWPAVDLIPDVTPFIGTVDDSAAGALAMLIIRSYFTEGDRS